METNAVRYPERHIRVRGSVITWTLHSKLHDAFLIWVLAYDFNTRPSGDDFYNNGRIKARSRFLKYLCREMACTAVTARKRLKIAIKARFLTEDDGDILLVGAEKLVKVAFDQQSRAFSEKRSPCTPNFFFEDDRKYTISAGDLVDPESVPNTKALLYGIMAVYGNRHLWSRETHANLLRTTRSPVIRLSKKAKVKTTPAYICIDPLGLLNKPKCTRTEAIEAFQKAEVLYRTGSKVRGRSLVQRRTIPTLDSTNFKTCLTFQLPNLFNSNSIIREVPASTPKFVVTSLSRCDNPGYRVQSISNCDGTDVGSTPTQEPARRGKRRELPAGGRSFLDARALLEIQKLSDSFIARYLSSFSKVLDNEDCQRVILSATGAQGLNPLSFVSPILYRGEIDRSRVTPFGNTVRYPATT